MVSGRPTRNLNPEVEVDFGAVFDSVTLDLGERWGWRTGLGWRRYVSPRVAAGLELFYESWDPGQSDAEMLSSGGLPAATVFQPRSESRNYGVTLRLRRDW